MLAKLGELAGLTAKPHGIRHTAITEALVRSPLWLLSAPRWLLQKSDSRARDKSHIATVLTCVDKNVFFSETEMWVINAS